MLKFLVNVLKGNYFYRYAKIFPLFFLKKDKIAVYNAISSLFDTS